MRAGRYDVAMNLVSLKDSLAEKARRLDPLLVDLALGIGLTLLVCLQLWLITHLRPLGEIPIPPGMRVIRMRLDPGPLPYLLVACVFFPLALRRSIPWLAFVLSGLAAAFYAVGHFPPAPTLVGPMIALYSLAAYTRRRTAMIALLVVGLVIAVPVLVFFASGVPRVGEFVGTFALLMTAALLGDTARNRREYIAQVEMRAIEAERTRDEEALRRVEEERVRIARDVHDIVAHSLSIVTVQAAAAEAVLDRDPEQARESIRNIRATGQEALGQLRSMLDVLRAGDADAASPLAPSADLTHLDQLLGPVRDAGLDVSLGTEGHLGSVAAYASVSAYRIVQEALTNAVRHSGASHIDVQIVVADRELRLRIADDGRGAPATSGASDAELAESPGHGIRGMRERVEALGGGFSAGNAASGGFEVSATIPLRSTT